jgi:hypothetical protein
MTLNLLKKDKRAAKVICCYFGNRRDIHNTPKNIADFVRINIENEISINNGIPTDVFLINNDVSNLEMNEMIMSYNGVKTNDGVIIVRNRQNLGGSFGAYYETFISDNEKYDYWFFCEDDVMIFKENYMKLFSEFLDSSDIIGFVSLAPLSKDLSRLHSGGGCGLTSTEKFIKSRGIKYMSDFLNQCPAVTDYSFLENSEIDFTNTFVRYGLEIKNHPEFSPFCINYTTHLGQRNNLNELVNLEKIYKVGF